MHAAVPRSPCEEYVSTHGDPVVTRQSRTEEELRFALGNRTPLQRAPVPHRRAPGRRRPIRGPTVPPHHRSRRTCRIPAWGPVGATITWEDEHWVMAPPPAVHHEFLAEEPWSRAHRCRSVATAQPRYKSNFSMILFRWTTQASPPTNRPPRHAQSHRPSRGVDLSTQGVVLTRQVSRMRLQSTRFIRGCIEGVTTVGSL